MSGVHASMSSIGGDGPTTYRDMPYGADMEAFESFVAVALESEGFVVSSAVKFPVTRQTAKAQYPEVQTHGYEVDLIAARADQLVLATVKSFFGSQGVKADHVIGTSSNTRWRKAYALLNDPAIRDGVVVGACERYGYKCDQVELRLYVGKFGAPKTGTHEQAIRAWCAAQSVGRGPIQVLGVDDVVDKVIRAAAAKQYRDNPVLVTMKVLEAAGVLKLDLPTPPT
jgi:hypothetical protein